MRLYLDTNVLYLSEPLGSKPLVDAVYWIEQIALGTIATTIAIIAVAGTGIMMLAGRIDIRRGVTVIIGCFLIFGASNIAAGLQAMTTINNGEDYSYPVAREPMPPSLPNRSANTPSGNYDPYAGASVPVR